MSIPGTQEVQKQYFLRNVVSQAGDIERRLGCPRMQDSRGDSGESLSTMADDT
jgi:hypothetical protein